VHVHIHACAMSSIMRILISFKINHISISFSNYNRFVFRLLRITILTIAKVWGHEPSWMNTNDVEIMRDHITLEVKEGTVVAYIRIVVIHV
jgi:ligand-binding SRPBCC domain-containing protein